MHAQKTNDGEVTEHLVKRLGTIFPNNLAASKGEDDKSGVILGRMMAYVISSGQTPRCTATMCSLILDFWMKE